MMLLTPELRFALRANDMIRRIAAREGGFEPDPVPIVKFFNPCGAATWLATELDEDDDTLFGLADLGFGCPELGYFSLNEIANVRLPFGWRIERDLCFAGRFPLSVYSEAARCHGRIVETGEALRAAAASLHHRNSGLPPTSG